MPGQGERVQLIQRPDGVWSAKFTARGGRSTLVVRLNDKRHEIPVAVR